MFVFRTGENPGYATQNPMSMQIPEFWREARVRREVNAETVKLSVPFRF